MTTFKDRIPTELVTHTLASCGEDGEQWINELPQIIWQLEKLWSIDVGDPFPSIEFNYVAVATTSKGEATVVKIGPPFDDTEIFSEAVWLRSMKGAGAIRLLAEDRSRRAILIERAIPGKHLAELFSGNELEAIEPAIDVLRRIIRIHNGAMSEVIDLDDWFDGLRRSSKSAFPRDYTVKALDFYDRLRRVDRFYLHGDFHPGNIVSASRSPYLAIDPKGIVGPVGYDIAVFLNNFHWWQETRTDVKDRLAIAVKSFADAFDVDPIELRQWAFAQMVLGAWWTFDEMPSVYNNEVAKADIWEV
jgi:streptomycin 6-kinase